MCLDALRRSGLVVAGGLALLGCATPVTYGPIGVEHGSFGYSDMRNDVDGSYTVRVVAASAEQAHEFWNRRAAELCGGPNFRKNIFRAEIPVVSYTGYASGPNGYGGSYTQDRYGPFILEGYLHCEGDAPATEAEAAATPAPAETPVGEGTPPSGSETQP